MPSVRLKKEDRENLLFKLRDGYDLESAGSLLGLNKAQIGLAKSKHGDALGEAFKTGTAKLRTKIMKMAINEENPVTLLKLLELREKQVSESDKITVIERVFIPDTCPHCGKEYNYQNTQELN